VILDILLAARRYENILFADDEPAMRGRRINEVLVVSGVIEAFRSSKSAEVIIALGNPDMRVEWGHRAEASGIPLLNAIHPSAVVTPSACLGTGIMVGANAVINSNARVSSHAIINTAAVVEHDCDIAEGAAVSPGARIGGRVKLGRCAFIGSGAIVTSRVSVGDRSVVGAGAVVNRDLPANVLAFGVPARIQRTLDPSFDWSTVL
jgi:sugar O-acyltransferase (sialic acid O-acetyltransferase NeuD family)